MIIARAPLRVSLFGGGSDLPVFLKQNHGSVLSFAINLSVFVIGHPFRHRSGLLLKYSTTEDVAEAVKLAHPIAREVFCRYSVKDFDVAVMSDVPAGSGLGSSSAFTVACLAFARAASKIESTSYELAHEAAEIEISVLGEPIGRQDQWASAYGDFNRLDFSGEAVTVQRIGISAQTKNKLERSLFLLPVGGSRQAKTVITSQIDQYESGGKIEGILRKMVLLVDEGIRILQQNIDDLGPLLNETWALKREMASQISNETIDHAYRLGLDVGATGGKLLGAGASGYLLFYVPESAQEKFQSRFPSAFRILINPIGGGVVHES